MRQHQATRMSGARAVLEVWWVQLILGLSLVALSLFPWLLSGSNVDAVQFGQQGTVKSLLPHGVTHTYYLLALFALASLLAGTLARLIGPDSAKFTVLLGLGVLIGLLAAAYQSWTVLEPLGLGPEGASIAASHLWVALPGVVAALLAFAVLSRASLHWAAFVVALLSFAPSFWLAQVIGTGTAAERAFFAGPLILGLVLGSLGFSRAGVLIMWCVALLVQWLAPALLAVLDSQVRARGLGEGVLGDSARMWETMLHSAMEQHWIYATVITLAVAMFYSVVLLVVRKARHR